MRRRSSPTRRRFLKAIPAAVGSATAVPVVAQHAPVRISKEAIECGETLTGVDFDPAETDLMLNLVNTNREHYEAIRRVPLSAEVEPAFSYRPPRPRRNPKDGVRATRSGAARVRVPG